MYMYVCVCVRARSRVCIIYIIFNCACLLRKSTGKKDQVRTIQFLVALPSPIPPFPSLWRGREYWREKGEKKQRRARENGKSKGS